MTKSTKDEFTKKFEIILERDTVNRLADWCKIHQDFDEQEAIRFFIGRCLARC